MSFAAFLWGYCLVVITVVQGGLETWFSHCIKTCSVSGEWLHSNQTGRKLSCSRVPGEGCNLTNYCFPKSKHKTKQKLPSFLLQRRYRKFGIRNGIGIKLFFFSKRLTNCWTYFPEKAILSNILAWKCHFYHIINFQRDLALFLNCLFLYNLLILNRVLFFQLPFYFCSPHWVFLFWYHGITKIKPENNLVSMKWDSGITWFRDISPRYMYHLCPL